MEDNPDPAEEQEVSADRRAENPRTQGAAREPATRERIAERAYLIAQSELAGSDEENWLRAEQELLEEQELQER
ncbi:MAG: DUF2934 domain-containing protein [Candidatus Dormiibacterota bacterium]